LISRGGGRTPSSADEISPTVALARAASTASASRLPLPRRGIGERGERGLDGLRIALRFRRASFSICSRPHRGIVDLEHVDRRSSSAGTC
jgi:hypothetical protein